MSMREKIILLLAALAVGYGVYVLFFEGSDGTGQSSAPQATSSPTGATTIANQVQSTIASGRLSESEFAILAKAREPWNRDPFHSRTSSQAEDTTDQEQRGEEISFVYSGYVELGNRRYAVINGEEYTTGEELQPAGYFVRDILPDKVVIQGRQREITTPLIEETY